MPATALPVRASATARAHWRRFPTFASTVLPVARLDIAERFYRAVFGLHRADTDGRDDHALLHGGRQELALYAIRGFSPPTLDEPVLSCTLVPDEFETLTWRVCDYGGRVIRETDFHGRNPHLLFTDPGDCNVIECRAPLVRPARVAA